MTNPPPRPALRKATDSDIHPAVPRGGLHAVPDRSPMPPAEPVTGTAAASQPALDTGADLQVSLPRDPVPGPRPARGTPAAGGVVPAWWPSSAGSAADDGSHAAGRKGAKKAGKKNVTKSGKKATKRTGQDTVAADDRGRRDGKAGKAGKHSDNTGGKQASKPARPVTVKVPLAPDLAARLSAKAAEHRLTTEQALGELARVWLDG